MDRTDLRKVTALHAGSWEKEASRQWEEIFSLLGIDFSMQGGLPSGLDPFK